MPNPGETLANGTVVEGRCRSSAGEATGVGEQWELITVDPRRAHLPTGETLAPDTFQAGLVPYGDVWAPGEALGEHGFAYQKSSDPRFSAKWGWRYFDEPAYNIEGGSNGEALTSASTSSTSCSPLNTYDSSPAHNPFVSPPLGSWAGQFPGEAAASGAGLAVKRPGQYSIGEWRLEIAYEHVSAAAFAAHPFAPKPCHSGQLLFPEPGAEADQEELEEVAGAETNYRLAPPPASGGLKWVAGIYCLTTSSTYFAVDGASGPGEYTGDMSQWPSSPYINQYAAGSRLGLAGGSLDARPGATASGPASLLMGMRAALGTAAPASSYPSISALYAQTVDSAGDFEPELAVNLLKGLGWPNAVARPLGADAASVADAGPPYPIVYPNSTNEATIDKALQSGPVVLETELGTDEWGVAGSGHVILLVGIDPQQPGSYIVDDPAGNYFFSPNDHYTSSSYGYGVDFPKAWVLAYATGGGLIEFGSHASTSEPPSAPVSTETKSAGTTSGTPSPANNVAPHRVVRVSATQIRALLKASIVPSGKSAQISSLKKHLGFTLSFHAPEAGVVTINWYELSRGARLTTKTKPKPLLVARGQLSFAAAGKRTVTMHLTMAGAHLLKHARHLALTASGSFTPRGAASVATIRAFVLK